MLPPTLNLDGSLKKRALMLDKDGDQPGLYSPRPSNPAAPHASTAAAAADVIDDIDLESTGRSRLNSVDGERESSVKRATAPMTTLMEHLQARQRSPSLLRADTALVSRLRVEEAYVWGRPFKAYVKRYGAGAGKSAAKAGASTAAAAPVFRQNPLQYISALTTHNDYAAVGDRAGRVVVMRRQEMSAAEHRALLERERQEDDARHSGAARSPRKAHPHGSVPAHSRDPYKFHLSQQSYVSVIDPLNSDEVLPSVTGLAFLPSPGPTSYLITANEKVPKLYKIVDIRDAAYAFRAVDKIDSKTIGPLTASSRRSTVMMRPVTRYALNHEYNINSVCPLVENDQFVTADDLTMHLWCTEYPDTSIQTYDLRPPYEEEAKEAIRNVRQFPHEPFLLFAATSAGNVRVIDVRQALHWPSATPQLFVNPPRAADGDYNYVTNSLSDCTLSPCGRYVAGRDFMTVCLWDVRKSAAPSSPGVASTRSDGSAEVRAARQWELHPHLRKDLKSLYQSDAMFEPCDIQFINQTEVATGGFGSSLFTVSVTGADTEEPRDGAAEAQAGPSGALPSRGVRIFQLPQTEGEEDVARDTIPYKRAAAAAAASGAGGSPARNRGTAAAPAAETQLGSRVTLLSRPSVSNGTDCGFLLSCGQVVMQASYTTS